MSLCPKCKTEYRDGYNTCSDCESSLVDELPPTENETLNFDHEAFLISVGDKFEAEVIEAKLKSYGIPVLRKYKETGGYLDIYMGMTSLGVDLYVPLRLYDEAKQIIEIDNKDELDMDNDIKENERSYKRKRQIRAWIVLLLFVPGIVWMMIAVIYNVLFGIFNR